MTTLRQPSAAMVAACYARLAALRGFVEDCHTRFPDLASPTLHVSDDGTRAWLTDGEHGASLAELALPALPPMEERWQCAIPEPR